MNYLRSPVEWVLYATYDLTTCPTNFDILSSIFQPFLKLVHNAGLMFSSVLFKKKEKMLDKMYDKWKLYRKRILCIFLLFPVLIFSVNLAEQVIVDKSKSILYLMRQGKVIGEYHVVFGAHPEGRKQKQGDERTPEGKYILDSKNSHSSFYKAIRVSYPNKQDRERARKAHVNPGGAIMIHGQKNGFEWLSFAAQYFNWTDGCIAVKNKDMDEIWNAVKLGTPIEIKP